MDALSSHIRYRRQIASTGWTRLSMGGQTREGVGAANGNIHRHTNRISKHSNIESLFSHFAHLVYVHSKIRKNKINICETHCFLFINLFMFFFCCCCCISCILCCWLSYKKYQLFFCLILFHFFFGIFFFFCCYLKIDCFFEIKPHVSQCISIIYLYYFTLFAFRFKMLRPN